MGCWDSSRIRKSGGSLITVVCVCVCECVFISYVCVGLTTAPALVLHVLMGNSGLLLFKILFER